MTYFKNQYYILKCTQAVVNFTSNKIFYNSYMSALSNTLLDKSIIYINIIYIHYKCITMQLCE